VPVVVAFPIVVLPLPVVLMVVVPNSATDPAELPMPTAPVLVPVLMFVAWLFDAFRFSPPEPELIVVELAPFVLPSVTNLGPAPLAILIVWLVAPLPLAMFTAPTLVPVLMLVN